MAMAPVGNLNRKKDVFEIWALDRPASMLDVMRKIERFFQFQDPIFFIAVVLVHQAGTWILVRSEECPNWQS